MKPAAVILMLLPLAFAGACYLFPDSENAEVVLCFWALCTIACLACGFVIRRKHPRLAWACVGIGFLQIVLMLLPGLKRENAHAVAGSTAQAIRPNCAGGEGGMTVLFANGCACAAAPQHHRSAQ